LNPEYSSTITDLNQNRCGRKTNTSVKSTLVKTTFVIVWAERVCIERVSLNY